MNEKLQILITAGINEALSVKEINDGLKLLAQHPNLQNLKVGIEIDKSFLNEVTKLSDELNKVTRIIKEQSRLESEATKKTDQMTEAIKQQTKAQKELNLERRTTVLDAQGKIKRLTDVYGIGPFNKEVRDTQFLEGGVKQTTTLIENTKLREQAELKRIHNIDRAHAMAFREQIAREKELGTYTGQVYDKKVAHFLAERENRQRIAQQQKEQNALERKNLKLRQDILLQIRRMELDPSARRGKGQLIEYRNELQRLNMTAVTTADRMRQIQHSIRAMGVEFQGATVKTSTIMGAFQNALMRKLVV